MSGPQTEPGPDTAARRPRLIYCHCAYAQVVPPAVKEAVLEGLCSDGEPFEAVADLCEASARKDPELARLAASGDVRIVACFPRAVRWLFAAARAPLPASAEILNMRVESAAAVLDAVRNPKAAEPAHPNHETSEP